VTGVIEGGWEFVVGAYMLTTVVLGVYVFSVLARHSKEVAHFERESGRGAEVE
jgi:hypothetical protein